MQYAQDKVKKMRGTKRSKSKGATKRARVSTASSTFKAAVAKEVVKQKARDMGYKDPTAAVADTVHTPDQNGLVILMPIPAQGSAETERVGKKMLWHSLQLRGSIVSSATTVLARGFWAIIYDREPQGAVPAFNSIFQVGATNGSIYSSNAMLNPDTSARYSVVARRDFEITARGSDNSMIPLEEWIDLKKKECVFKSAGSGIGDIQKGALYFVTGSSIPTADVATSFSITFGRRVRFIDV